MFGRRIDLPPADPECPLTSEADSASISGALAAITMNVLGRGGATGGANLEKKAGSKGDKSVINLHYANPNTKKSADGGVGLDGREGEKDLVMTEEWDDFLT